MADAFSGVREPLGIHHVDVQSDSPGANGLLGGAHATQRDGSVRLIELRVKTYSGTLSDRRVPVRASYSHDSGFLVSVPGPTARQLVSQTARPARCETTTRRRRAPLLRRTLARTEER
jgi:hypothetical protein